MGMFDELKCEYPLPDPEAQDFTFQTKSLDRSLANYVITKDGKLLSNENTCLNERDPKETEQCEEVPHHGDISFHMVKAVLSDGRLAVLSGQNKKHAYTRGKNNEEIPVQTKWFEYKARFTNGQLEWIKRISDRNNVP